MDSDQPTADEEKQRLAGLFSRAAPTYDHVGPGFFAYFGRRLVEFACIPSEAHVLDVATGRGAILFPAAEAVGPRGHATGIDLSDAMVQQTIEEIDKLNLANVYVLPMDAEDIRFPDASFDYVLCGFAIFFFPQLDQALAEMRRVLKPNGHIALSTWDRIGDEQHKWFEDLIQEFLPRQDEPEQSSESQAPPSPEFDTPGGLTAIIQSAGFTNVLIARSSAENIYAGEGEWWSSLWSHGARAVLERIEQATGPDGLERFRLAAFEKIQAIKQPDGIHQSRHAIFGLGTKSGE